MTDGGAAAVLVTDQYLRDHPGARPIARITGWGHRTVGLGLQQKLDRAADDPYVLPHVRAAVLDALRRAKVSLDDVDGIEVHDCFTPSEYLAIDHFGITAPGDSWKAIDGGNEIGGRIPRQPERRPDRWRSPGRRHRRPHAPRREQAGDRPRRRLPGGGTRGGPLNIGGTTTTTVSFVVSEAHRAVRREGRSDRRKLLSTLPEDDDHPYRTGPWRPQTAEWNADDLEVEGEIPTDLDGVYLRNTENPVHPALKIYHPFDGDGMLHVVGFRDGDAFYRNRFVRTDGFLAEQKRASRCGRASPNRRSRPTRTGWGARTRMKDASSTDVSFTGASL